MKLNMSAGHLAGEIRSVGGDFAVHVEEGDSRLADIDRDAKTLTVYASGAAKKSAPIPAPKPKKAAKK